MDRRAARALPVRTAAAQEHGPSSAPCASPARAANECGDPSANGAAPDFLACSPGAYPAGIDYSTTSTGVAICDGGAWEVFSVKSKPTGDTLGHYYDRIIDLEP